MWGSSPLYAQVGSRSFAAAAATITTSASEKSGDIQRLASVCVDSLRCR